MVAGDNGFPGAGVFAFETTFEACLLGLLLGIVLGLCGFLVARSHGEEEICRVLCEFRGMENSWLKTWVVWKGDGCRARHSREKKDIYMNRQHID